MRGGGIRMEQERVKAAVKKAGDYIDKLTIKSKENVPQAVLSSQDKFF